MTKAQEKAAMPAAKKAVIEAARKRVEAKKGLQKTAPDKPTPKAEPKKKNKVLKAGETFMKGMMSVREKQMKKAGME